MFLDVGPEQLRSLIDAFGTPVFVVDVEADGAFRFAAINAAHEAMTGMQSAAIGGRRPQECLPPATARVVIARYRRCVEARRAIAYEEDLDLPTGRFWWRTTLVPLFDRRTGRVARLMGTAIDIGEQRRAEAARRTSEQRLADFLATASDWLWEMDADLRFSFLCEGNERPSPQAELVIGKTRWELAGADPESDPHWRRHRDDLLARRPFRNFEMSFVDQDGRRHYRSVSGGPVFDEQGAFAGYRGTARDTGAQFESDRRLRESEQRLALALEAAQAGWFDIDLASGRGQYSPPAETMLGYAPGELNASHEPWPTRVHPDDLPALRQALDAHLAGHSPTYRAEYRHRTRDGGWRWMAAAGQAVERDSAGASRRLIGIRIDIHERRQAQLKIERMALEDSLTGLPNRHHFHKELERACARADRSGCKVAVLLLDLDNFKDVNDTLGHAIGDALLIEAGRRLGACIRAGDMVTRLGGDEFAIIAGEDRDPKGFTHLADRVIEVLSEPFRIGGTVVRTTTSVGVTVYPDDHGGVEQLLTNADVALYAAKGDGRQTWRLYDRSMHEAVQGRRTLENDLRHALEQEQFELYYQPVIDLRTLAVSGVEALVRWNHPTRGRVGPDEFIAAAEANRLIVPLSEWILHRAMLQSNLWRAAGMGELGIAVNVSSRSLKTEGLIESVVRSLATTRADPGRLIIEVTETSLADEKQAVPVIDALRALGVRIAVDDFGTGYSSMARLKTLPVDRLKIDRSFVVDSARHPRNAAIIESMIKLADSLDVTIVAEGIETARQLELLRELGCHEGQGFLFAPAMPAAELGEWLAAWQPRLRAPAREPAVATHPGSGPRTT